MRKLYPNSRIEIWDVEYINYNNRRMEHDKNVDIVQIERGVTSDEYIVEIVDKTDKEATL